jgi:hypothetical protein
MACATVGVLELEVERDRLLDRADLQKVVGRPVDGVVTGKPRGGECRTERGIPHGTNS